jgi:hypothetical protein
VGSYQINIETIRLLIDAGLFILSWLVQLVIYPSFCYYSEANIKRWHSLYTKRISWIVLPLMLSQLFLYGSASFLDPSLGNIGALLMVISLWLVTLLFAVPLHRKIEIVHDSMKHRRKLIQLNWYRTLLWTLILMYSILSYGE